MNKYVLTGNLTKDPELKTTTNDLSVAKLHSKFQGKGLKGKNAQGRKKKLDFKRCV